MAVRPAKQGCVALLMGKSPYLFSERPVLMKSLDIAARLRTTVALGANLNMANALEPPDTSAGICDSTDTYFVAGVCISKAREENVFQCNDWLASLFFYQTVPNDSRYL